eukprot:TRINITY_DN4878_c0_g1_i1.p1 TRINITY_DN4878_c0_g1~~TRINITY_DN4878_c0_g1_i1.p1  ORF type:complete len:522 (+),score=97.63 TRINITY_DN4878_c0_g1_i1:241-1806(+)
MVGNLTSATYMIFSLLLLHSCVFTKGESIAYVYELDWAGGTDDCQIEGCVDMNYACNTGSQPGDWSDGEKYYEDLNTDPKYFANMVMIALYGSFDCSYAHNLTFELNSVLIGTVHIPVNKQQTCVICQNCVTTPIFFNSSYREWPKYSYANSNQIKYYVDNTTQGGRLCLSTMNMTIIYSQLDGSSSSSSDGHDVLDAPSWFYGVIGGTGFIIFLLLLILGVIWFRSRENQGGSGAAYRPLGHTEYLDPSQLHDIKIESRELVLENEIGHGSFGQVYRGVWRGTEVAIKKLPKDSMMKDNQSLSDFMKEAFIMRQLRHPNVLQVLGICLTPSACIVMEYMPKGSLFHQIHTNTVVLDWPIIRKVCIEVCRGMAYLHGCNPPLIHRDLKPHNLLVDEHWRVKVCDFGLSKFLEPKKDMTACGTPAYAAPEVLRNSSYTTSADVYSFGICVWEMISRTAPYHGMPPFQIIFNVGTQGTRPPMPDGVHPLLAGLIQECWAEDPASRPSFLTIADRLTSMPSSPL